MGWGSPGVHIQEHGGHDGSRRKLCKGPWGQSVATGRLLRGTEPSEDMVTPSLSPY